MAIRGAQENDLTKTTMAALRWRIRGSALALVWERLVQCFWPLMVVVLLLVTLILWDVAAFLPVSALRIGVAGFLAAAGFFLVRGLRRFRIPDRAGAILRLDNHLKDRPISALNDHLVLGAGNPETCAVWRAHLGQMATEAQRAKARWPQVRLAAQDPWAVRLMSLTAFAVALMFAGGGSGVAVIDRLQGSDGSETLVGANFEGWAEPPFYTGKPAIYLTGEDIPAVLPLPWGTDFTLRIYGTAPEASVLETVSGQDQIQTKRTGTGVQEYRFQAENSGTLSVDAGPGEPFHWRVQITPDRPPNLSMTDAISRTPQGAMQLPYGAQDDYGVVGGVVEIDLDLPAVSRKYGLVQDPEPRPVITLDVPLPLVGNRKDFHDTMTEDLAKHPWAGLPVTLRMNIHDDLDQVAAIDPLSILLPGRRFFDPMAGALAEQRRDLLWSGENAQRVAQILRALTYLPEDVFASTKAYLVTRVALRRLEFALESGLIAQRRDEVAELLWRAAILIEEGDLGDAAERLRRAQERLSEALENGATQEEIAELMDELRQASDDYIRQLAKNAEQNRDSQTAGNQQALTMTQDQLQQLLDRIEELSQQGRMAEAQELLQQLRELMENMQVTQGQQGQQGDQGQQAIDGLRDTLRQQQGLADEAFQHLQEQFNRERQRGQKGQNGEQVPGENYSLEQGLAGRQGALQDLLSQQQGQLSNPDSPEGRAGREALERAERHMGRAREKLEQGNAAEALNDQADAMEALREGIKNLGQALAQAEDQGQGQQGAQSGSQQNRNQRDPLGRTPGTSGQLGSDENLLPGTEAYRRSREIMDEIRRRSGDQSRPTLELEYLKRLLDRF